MSHYVDAGQPLSTVV